MLYEIKNRLVGKQIKTMVKNLNNFVVDRLDTQSSESTSS